jgi:hypothetical protein
MMFWLLLAEAAVAAAPIVAVAPNSSANRVELPANTEVLLRTNDALTSKNAQEGDSFSLSVAHDVMLSGYVVIPRGTRAVGEITWRTGKGMFGKSGKMDIELRYIDLGGRRIPIEGKFRQEGSGNTVATATSVALLWPVAPVITGKSATIPKGRELMAHTPYLCSPRPNRHRSPPLRRHHPAHDR